jgi:hypothetical protein
MYKIALNEASRSTGWTGNSGKAFEKTAESYSCPQINKSSCAGNKNDTIELISAH